MKDPLALMMILMAVMFFVAFVCRILAVFYCRLCSFY